MSTTRKRFTAEQIVQKLRGTPDGNGPGRDWIVLLPDQIDLYLLLVSASDCLPQ